MYPYCSVRYLLLKNITANSNARINDNLNEICLKNEARIQTHNIELDRVLGGGIVPGAILLLGGEPGIGKSTLMLQLALSLQNCKTLYVSGEESDKQIKMRAERLGEEASDCYILTETATQNIFTHINALEPDLVVIDSIQTLHTQAIDSSPGSISQIRENASTKWKTLLKVLLAIFSCILSTRALGIILGDTGFGLWITVISSYLCGVTNIWKSLATK